MSDEKLRQLEERILRLERQNLELKRARKGLIVEPNLNILGQQTRIDGSLSVASNINLNEITTPSTPPSGQVSLYAKADGLPFVKNDAGVESPIALGGVWQDWTPTLTNLSGGTLNYARYCVIGKFCSFIFKYTLGGAGVGSTPIISLPLTAAASMEDQNIGNARFDDVGTRANPGSVMIESTLGTFYLVAHNTAATYSYLTPISGTIPHTWANTDRIRAQGIYEIA